ncbi:GIY-YIG nuclease family protein [Vibrio scophthalmi]|uniref:GIY-YIG nuclease family protein n=1 Tax=Vibrio scophthalmi TaxID=45658 RepID=UPI0022848578|nr:GIY-YIG nuclease family protein [Vibrio scophthalmi]MCY9803302.1 GIY-YIG nuclease family protein [Vibrio scophthalmi]
MTNPTETLWSVYFVRTRSDKLYCGITTNVERRFEMHCAGTGAKALRGQGPLVLAWYHPAGDNRSIASKIEYQLKQIHKSRKEALICGKLDLNEALPQEYCELINPQS